MDTDEPIPELTNRDKLFLRVLEDLPPDLVNVLINIQQHQGRPMAQKKSYAKLDIPRSNVRRNPRKRWRN
jgi:hypothetical protein